MSLKTEQKKKRKSNFLYDFVRITGAIPTLLLMRPKIVYFGKGKISDIKRGLVCANHSSFLDPALILCAFWKRRLHFLATADLFQSPVKKFFFSRMNCIPVDKQNFSMDSLHSVCDELKGDKMVIIFPEGSVHAESNGEVGEFKNGAMLMSYLAEADLIPMYIFPVKKWYRRRVAVIGDPIRIREICPFPSMPAMDKAGDILRERILDLEKQYVEKYRNGRKEK